MSSIWLMHKKSLTHFGELVHMKKYSHVIFMVHLTTSVYFGFYSHAMDRGQFYKDAQTSLLQAKSWEDFIQTNKENPKEIKLFFSYPHHIIPVLKIFTMDTISIKLMPEDANPQLIPIEVVDDGN